MLVVLIGSGEDEENQHRYPGLGAGRAAGAPWTPAPTYEETKDGVLGTMGEFVERRMTDLGELEAWIRRHRHHDDGVGDRQLPRNRCATFQAHEYH